MENELTHRTLEPVSSSGFSDYIDMIVVHPGYADVLQLSSGGYEVDPSTGSLRSIDVVVESVGVVPSGENIRLDWLTGFDFEIVDLQGLYLTASEPEPLDVVKIQCNKATHGLSYPIISAREDAFVAMSGSGPGQKGTIRLKPNWWLGGSLGNGDQEIGSRVHPHMYELYLGLDPVDLPSLAESLDLTIGSSSASGATIGFFIPTDEECVDIGYPTYTMDMHTSQVVYSRVIGVELSLAHGTGEEAYAQFRVNLPLVDAIVLGPGQSASLSHGGIGHVVHASDSGYLVPDYGYNVVMAHQDADTSGSMSNWRVFCVVDPAYIVTYGQGIRPQHGGGAID